MRRAAVADVEAAGIAQDHVVLAHVETGELAAPVATRELQADFVRIHLLGIELGHRLVALQPVEFRHLGRAEAARRIRIQHQACGRVPAQAELGRRVGERIVAIGRAAVQAACRQARHAVLVGIAGQHAIVIPVADVFHAHAGAGVQRRCQGVVELGVGASHVRRHGVVVMQAGRTDRVRRGTAAGRGVLLVLDQERIRPLEVETGDQARRAPRGPSRSSSSRPRFPGRCVRPVGRAGSAAGSPCATCGGRVAVPVGRAGTSAAAPVP